MHERMEMVTSQKFASVLYHRDLSSVKHRSVHTQLTQKSRLLNIIIGIIIMIIILKRIFYSTVQTTYNDWMDSNYTERKWEYKKWSCPGPSTPNSSKMPRPIRQWIINCLAQRRSGMVLVLQVVNSSSSSTQHLTEFAVWYLPAVTDNYTIIICNSWKNYPAVTDNYKHLVVWCVI